MNQLWFIIGMALLSVGAGFLAGWRTGIQDFGFATVYIIWALYFAIRGYQVVDESFFAAVVFDVIAVIWVLIAVGLVSEGRKQHRKKMGQQL